MSIPGLMSAHPIEILGIESFKDYKGLVVTYISSNRSKQDIKQCMDSKTAACIFKFTNENALLVHSEWKKKIEQEKVTEIVEKQQEKYILFKETLKIPPLKEEQYKQTVGSVFNRLN